MSLAVRVIPTMLCRGEQLVKGREFNGWRVVGHAMQAARIHAARGVDELILLDIAATPEGRGPDIKLIEKLSEFCHTPLTVGGGVRSAKDVYQVLRAGADKVAIGAAAAGNGGLRLVRECADAIGSQAIVVAVDVKDGTVWSHAGTRDTKNGALSTSMLLEQAGAGEILLTSIDREGTMMGYDISIIKRISRELTIPVIAHGGCSGYLDMHQAINAGASAVAAGALFQFTDATPRGAVEYLEAHGVTIRIPA